MLHISPPVEVVGRFDPAKAELFAHEQFESFAAETHSYSALEGSYEADTTFGELSERIGLDLDPTYRDLRFLSTFSKFPALIRPATKPWHVEANRNRLGLPRDEFAFLIGVSSLATKIVEGLVVFSDENRPESEMISAWSRPAIDLMTEQGQQEVDGALQGENPTAKLSDRFTAGDVIYLPKGVIHRGSQPGQLKTTLPRYRYVLNGFYTN
ncbi:MAG: hypothetical protein Q7T41_01365 [Candidatus Saccharibacteria bacterium]|nr:hypothetical protein [Candidatus Saccharibacteria bacterium]